MAFVSTEQYGLSMKRPLAIVGLVISCLSAFIACVPLLGIYGFAGALGILFCLLSFTEEEKDSGKKQVGSGIAILGILVGLGACFGAWFWLDLLNHSSGHFF